MKSKTTKVAGKASLDPLVGRCEFFGDRCIKCYDVDGGPRKCLGLRVTPADVLWVRCPTCGFTTNILVAGCRCMQLRNGKHCYGIMKPNAAGEVRRNAVTSTGLLGTSGVE